MVGRPARQRRCGSSGKLEEGTPATDAAASAQHEAWLSDKLRDGWKFGPVKDPTKKEHPCMVPYSELPLEQRIKDHLLKAVVQAFVEAGG
ncbi:MAG: RyR domain-containing protein [Bryobacteraceae bacterium]